MINDSSTDDGDLFRESFRFLRGHHGDPLSLEESRGVSRFEEEKQSVSDCEGRCYRALI